MDLSHFIYINLTLGISCLIFLIFLVIIYFSKKNMNNLENKIYRHMLITNGLCILDYIISYSLFIHFGKFPNYHQYDYFVYIPAKLAPMFIDMWGLLVIYYILVITTENNEKVHKFLTNKSRVILFLIYGVCCAAGIITLLFENIEFDYRTGIETDHVFISLSIILYGTFLSMFALIISRGKKVPKKKSLPLYLIMFISIIAFAAGMINVPIVLLFAMITVINQMMYHTIENPDMKLVNELTLAKDQAEKANHAKSDFLASMSHELKTPLNSIIGLTDVMSDCYDIDEIHTDLKDISSSSRKLLELVDGILTINTLDSNDIQIINSEYSFKSIIDDLDNSVSLRIGDKPIEFRKKISSDLPNTLYGDKDKVKTIINHLVSNAIKYTNEGVVELSIDSIVIKDKCNLRITVTDTGVGIKEEDLANIFDKFYRSEENKDSDISGTGLGLSITKSIVDLMEGKITVNSTVGVGTTFTVTLSQKVVESNNNQEAEIL